MPARLLLVGDGPELGDGATGSAASSACPIDVHVARRAGGRHAAAVGRPIVFLLPSAQESFGLAALEAMACEVPVVASRVGGLPEVIEHGVSGFLHAPDDLDGMAAERVALLTDPALHARDCRLGPPNRAPALLPRSHRAAVRGVLREGYSRGITSRATCK